MAANVFNMLVDIFLYRHSDHGNADLASTGNVVSGVE